MANSAGPAAKQSNALPPESLAGANGFVRVGRTASGQWWLVDADNQPFFARGVSGVNRFGRAAGRGSQPGPYELAVDQRYGGADSPRFVDTTLGRLRAWQVNTLGPGTTPDFFDRGMFFVETVGFRQAAPEATIKLAGALLPDVFDPRWTAACGEVAARVCAPLRENRELIGYCTDRGLQWSQPAAGAAIAKRPERPSLLQICLSLEPSFPAYHAAWEFALAAHAGELASLARSWGIEPRKEALRQLTLADTPLTSAGYLRDHDRFTREFARRYFQTCTAAIRQCDPHHLVLGSPFETPPVAAVLAECVSPAVDVLTIHAEGPGIFKTIEACAHATGRPVLVTEFSWAHESFAAAKPGARRRTSVERMLANGRAALMQAYAQPALVGALWARWADQPGEVPPFARGLVHLDDFEAREHTELLTELNRRAERLHRAGLIRP